LNSARSALRSRSSLSPKATSSLSSKIQIESRASRIASEHQPNTSSTDTSPARSSDEEGSRSVILPVKPLGSPVAGSILDRLRPILHEEGLARSPMLLEQ